MTAGFATFENLDTVVSVRIVTGGDIDSEVETHLVEAVVDGGGGENADTGIFNAEGFESLTEILNDPLGGFTSVAAEHDFDFVAGVIDETADDFGEEFGGELFGFLPDTIGTKIFHSKLLNTLMVNMTSVRVLPRERSASGTTNPWMRGPATVKPPKRSRDL